jgi:drug/metabolite transporter (DMT)-like permease
MGLLVLLAPLAVCVSTLVIKQRAASASSLILNRDSILIGAALLSILAFVFERDESVTFSASAIGSILYLALFGTVFTFGVYLWLLRSVPAYRMSLTAFVTPVVALLVGALLGGEPLHAHTLAGTACVLGGVALVLGRPARRS